MAISRVHVWASNEVLTASDLNAEFNNIINTALSLVSPLTGSLDFNGNTALNFRFQNQSATQSAAAEGVAYWQSTEDCLHISTGTVQARVPALQGIQQGELVGITNPTGVSGATQFSRIQPDSTLSLSGTTLSVGTVTAAKGGTGIDTSATAAGALLSTSATGVWTTVAPGSTGQVLNANTGTVPSWATPPFTSSYASGTLTVGAASAFSVAHGLGGIPSLVQLRLKNVTAENGYSIGDEVNIEGTISEVNASGRGASVACDATSIYVMTGAAIALLNRGTAADTGAITLSSWRWVVRAWK